jgi:hypothetical protein
MPFFPRSPLRQPSLRDDGRRRDDSGGVRALVFELEDFEFVESGGELGLLRMAGRWLADEHRAVPDVLLTVERGGELIELEPLPDPNGTAPRATPAGEPWRGAFSMPVELAADPHSRFALAAGDETPVTLPRPGEWIDGEEQVAMEPPAEPVEPVVLAADPAVEALEVELAGVRAELKKARAGGAPRIDALAHPAARPLDDEFLGRLERAKRLSSDTPAA